MKIALSAGHNVINNGVFDSGTVSPDRRYKEADITRETVRKLIPLLRNQGHIVKDVTPYNERFKSSKMAHKERGRRVEEFDPDIYLDIHMNAGGGTGPETIVYSTTSKSYVHARNITNSIAQEFRLTNRRGVRVRPNYWSVSMQSQPSIIVEGAFLDSPGGMDMINFSTDKYAKAIAKCFGKVEGKEFTKLYKVQLGAYSKRENADRLLKELKSKGFDGFIKLPANKDDYYRVQTGVYSIKANADNLLSKLNKQGFKGFLVVEEKDRNPIAANKKAEYFKVGDAHVIKTTPENIYIAHLGTNLAQKGVYGINGTFFDTSVAKISNPESNVFIAMNNGKPLSNNSQFNGWIRPPRGTIYFTKDGRLGNRKVKSVNELPKNINWAIGGYTVKPYMDFKNEGITDSVNYKTAHSYIGFDNKGYVYLIARPYHRIYEIVPILDSLNITQAIVLDGGGSTQLRYETDKLYSRRAIASAVLIKSL